MRKWRNLAEYRSYHFELGKMPHAPRIESTCIFDDLYFIGDDFVGCYVLDTGEGLIMIDCGYDDDYFFDQINNAFERFDLDLKDLRYLCISHGHFDHYGCAGRLKERSDVKIVMSEKEYRLACDEDFQIYGTMNVKPDLFVEDNMILSLGNQTLRFIQTPGHTGETTSYIFKVFDEGKAFNAELFSGCGITRFMDEDAIREYIGSVRKWKRICEEEDTQVILSCHPMQINLRERTALIRNINNIAIGNPFLVGRQGCVCFEELLLHRGIKALKRYKNTQNDDR